MTLPYQVTGTAFITGGGSGLARGAAFVFAQNGIQGLALLDIDSDALNSTKKELNELHPNVTVETFTVDVTDEQAVATAVAAVSKQFGRIDIALHAAGITHIPRATHELPLEVWQQVIDINQTGLMICEKWVVQQMLTQESRGEREGRGTIVNITSMLGVTTTKSNLGATAYVASKHAVTALTKADAKSYAKDGIRINAICPGYVDTPLTHDYIVSGTLDAELQHAAVGRPAQIDEIANAILFLSSPMSSYMFGSALVIDGGYSA